MWQGSGEHCFQLPLNERYGLHVDHKNLFASMDLFTHRLKRVGAKVVLQTLTKYELAR